MDESLSKITRKRGTFRFRTFGDAEVRERRGIVSMKDVTIDPIDWLWEPYIPLGRLTMLGGDPGAGKSFITVAIGSALSRGDSLPGEKEGVREPMNVLMLNAEDDPGDTIKPRLNNLRADQTRIFVSAEDLILDDEGLAAIREMAIETEAKLVTIDPIVAFLGPKMDMNRANEVRHIMKGLKKIASDLNIAIVVVRHNRKSVAGDKALYAGMGSIDFTASVRSELAVTTSKSGVKFLNHIKANSGKQGNSIIYEIEPQADGSGLFRWGEFSSFPKNGPQTGKVLATKFKGEAEVRTWLHAILKDYPDGLPAPQIFEMGSLVGYSRTKLEHGKKGVVVSEKRGNNWVWKLDTSARVDFKRDTEVE